MANWVDASLIYKVEAKFTEDMPAYTLEVYSSNPNIEVTDVEFDCYSAKFNLMSGSGKTELASGSVGEEDQSLFVFGKTMFVKGTGTVEKAALGKQDGEKVVFDSSWIQSREQATSIADWIITASSNKQVLSAKVFGNPLLEVGDVVRVKDTIGYVEESSRFVIQKVRHSWERGLSTEITAVEI